MDSEFPFALPIVTVKGDQKLVPHFTCMVCCLYGVRSKQNRSKQTIHNRPLKTDHVHNCPIHSRPVHNRLRS